MKQQKGLRAFPVIFASALAMLAFGFTDIIKGSVVDAIIDQAQLGYSFGGLMLGITYFGFFVGTLLSVLLVKRFSVANLLSVSVATMAIGTLIFALAQSGVQIIIAALVTGAGCGLIDVHANLLGRLSSTEETVGRTLNRISFFHGVGAILAPLFAVAVMLAFHRWQSVYWGVFLILAVAVVIVLFAVKISGYGSVSLTIESERLPFSRNLLLLGLFLFFYMSLEAGISGWLVSYLIALDRYTYELSHTMLSLFFIMLTIGRFLSSLYVDKVGLERTIILHILGSLGVLLLGTLIQPLAILLPLMGLMLAPLFPTTTALISRELGDVGLHIMGLFFAIGGLGGLFGPYVIGIVASSASLLTGFQLLILFAGVYLGLTLLYRRLSREGG